MFEVLDRVSPEQAISSAYYAIRLIRHRNEIADVRDGLIVDGLETEPTQTEQAIAMQMVAAICETEQTQFENLYDSTADEYILRLAQIAQGYARQQFGFDERRGLELLRELREPPEVAVSKSRAVF